MACDESHWNLFNFFQIENWEFAKRNLLPPVMQNALQAVVAHKIFDSKMSSPMKPLQCPSVLKLALKNYQNFATNFGSQSIFWGEKNKNYVSPNLGTILGLFFGTGDFSDEFLNVILMPGRVWHAQCFTTKNCVFRLMG